jgi:DNA-directed RNA polymerase specialized sigma subunit
MEVADVIKIIHEELSEVESRILKRLTDGSEPQPIESGNGPIKPLPVNENYAKALAAYQASGTHSGIAKALGVSLAQVKKYHNWLVKHGYLEVEQADLSDVEQRVVDCLFKKKMSLRETAKELGCSVTNVSYRRDSALRKGYKPQI